MVVVPHQCVTTLKVVNDRVTATIDQFEIDILLLAVAYPIGVKTVVAIVDGYAHS